MKTVHTNGPDVTPDEATELCIHHLRLAAMFYESAPDDNNMSINAEIERQCKQDQRSLKPALTWASSISVYYKKIRRSVTPRPIDM